MKIKIKQSFRSIWALILAVLMVMSTFTAAAVSLNIESVGASNEFVANQTLYVDIGSTWEENYNNNVNVPYVRFSYNDNDNDYNNPIKRVEIKKSDKVEGSIYKITVPNNNYCRALKFERTKYGEDGTVWDSVKTTSASRSSDSQNLFTITGYNGNNGWSVYSGEPEPEPEEYTIYFKDTLGWNAAYAHFYTDDNPYGGNGCSGSGAAKNVSLSRVAGETDVYSATFTSSTAYTKVCFTKDEQNSYGNFWQTEAAYRSDLDFASGNTMYVPNTTASETKNSNVPYYNNGAWQAYSSTPPTPTYTVTYGKSGNGTITAKKEDNSAVSSGASVDEGTSVTFTATPSSGYEVEGWYSNSGCTSKIDGTETATTYEAEVNANTTVYVKFKQSVVNYAVSTKVKVSTDGTSFADSTAISAPTMDKTSPVASGTEVTFTRASNDSGYDFYGWSVDGTNIISGTTTTQTLKRTITSETTVYALYYKKYTVTIGDHTNGTIKIDGTAANKEVNAGTTVTLTAEANSGYDFTAWTGAVSGSSATTTKQVTSDITVGATFTKQDAKTFDVTLTQPATGGTIECTNNYTGLSVGSAHTLNLVAHSTAGYVFKNWKTTSGTATFSDETLAVSTATVSAACTITAVFEEKPAAATGVSITGKAEVAANADVTYKVSATAADGATLTYTYYVDGVQIDETTDSKSFVHSFDTVKNGYVVKVVVSAEGFNPVEATCTTNVKDYDPVKVNAFTDANTVWFDGQPSAVDSKAGIIKVYEKGNVLRFYIPGSVNEESLYVYHNSSFSVNGTNIPQHSSATYNVKSWNNKSCTLGGQNKTIKVFKSNAKSIHFYDTYLDSDKTKTHEDMPTTTKQGVNNANDAQAYKSQCVYGGNFIVVGSGSDATLNPNDKKLKKIKGRGNSTWEASCRLFGKYAYNVQTNSAFDFVSATEGGANKSKKWSMLANNADESMMRNVVAYGLADTIGLESSPKSAIYDVYNRGNYLGSYQMSEKVEVADKQALVNGVNVDKLNEAYYVDGAGATLSYTRKYVNGSETTNNTPGFYKYCDYGMAGDPANYKDGNYLMEFELDERFADEISGFISNMGQQVVLNSPECATKNEVLYAMDRFNFAEAVIYTLAGKTIGNAAGTLTDHGNGTYSYTGKDSGVTYGPKAFNEIIDIDNFAKAYLIQEITENLDGVATSFYVDITGQNDSLVSKPVWDFDWTMGQYNKSKDIGTPGSLDPSKTNQWFIKEKDIYHKNGTKNFIAALCDIEDFWTAVKVAWDGSAESSLAPSSKKAPMSVGAGSTVYSALQAATGDTGLIKTTYSDMLGSSVAMNEDKYGFIASDPLKSANWGSKDTGGTWSAAVDYLDDWLTARTAWLNAELNDDETEKTVYFDNSVTNWSNVYAWVWKSGQNGKTYQLTQVDDTNIYSLTVPSDLDYVIFKEHGDGNWNAAKTGNLEPSLAHNMEDGYMFTIENYNSGSTNNSGSWSPYEESVKEYYIGGRLQQNWNPSSTSQKFTLVSDNLYKYETGKTVGQLSATWQDSTYTADQYFFVHEGDGVVANKWYGLTGGTFTTDNKSITLVKQTSASTDQANGLVRFNSSSDTSGPVTIYFNASTNELYYEVPTVEKHNVTKTVSNGTIDFTQGVTDNKAAEGATVKFTVSPNAGYKVDSVTMTPAGGAAQTLTATAGVYQFTMPTKDVTVTANISQIPTHEITVNTTGADGEHHAYIAEYYDATGTKQTSTSATNVNALEGTTVKVVAPSIAGYTFKNFNYSVDSSTVTDAEKTYTVTADATITATYEVRNVKYALEGTFDNGKYTESYAAIDDAFKFDGVETITIHFSGNDTAENKLRLIASDNNFHYGPNGVDTEATLDTPLDFYQEYYTYYGFTKGTYEVTIDNTGALPKLTVHKVEAPIAYALMGDIGMDNTWVYSEDTYDASTAKFVNDTVSFTIDGEKWFKIIDNKGHGYYIPDCISNFATLDTNLNLEQSDGDNASKLGTGTYKIDIVGVQSNGAPIIKITKVVQLALQGTIKDADGSVSSNWNNYPQVPDAFKFGTDTSITITANAGGQLRFIDSNNTQYGSTISGQQPITLGTEYSTTANDGCTYKFTESGTYKVTITGYTSAGAPKFKVTKEAAAGDVQLMYYTSKNIPSKSSLIKLTNLAPSETEDGIFEATYSFTKGDTFYLAVKDKNHSDNYFFDGGIQVVGSWLQYYNYNDGFNGATFNVPESGVYKVTWNSSNKQLRIDSAAETLAKSVALTASPTTQIKGKDVTLTATLNTPNKKLPADAELTYTFKDRNGNVVGNKKVTGTDPVSVTVKPTVVGDNYYYVEVSTNATYTEGGNSITFADVVSSQTKVEVTEAAVFYAPVDQSTGSVGTRAVVPSAGNVTPTVEAGGSYAFSLFDDPSEISEENFVQYPVNNDKSRYCTVTTSTTEDGVPYYVVNCNPGCTNPTIYISPNGVYAIAKYSPTKTNTIDNTTETVTYYFAKQTGDIAWNASKTNSGSTDGLRIKYWNNSALHSDEKTMYANCIDVTSKVNIDSSNEIYVNTKEFAGSSNFPSFTGVQEYKVYKVELPVWATSFDFVTGAGNDNPITLNSSWGNTCDKNNNQAGSIGLNPNRIYLLFEYGNKYFVRGVTLDESFWSRSTRTDAGDNEIATKTFSTNLVNYNSYKGDPNNTLNNELTAQYGTDYKHPLYFRGWYGSDKASAPQYGSDYFKLYENLALRWDSNHAYYASVQKLTDSLLSKTATNAQGNGLLLGYRGHNMPLFDYELLKSNNKLVYNNEVFEKLNFPFYQSTFNGVTTYSYDSFTDKNRYYDSTEKDFTVGGFKDGGASFGYFPFNQTDNNHIYGSGTEFNIDFYMTSTGALETATGGQQDICFNFNGDDDVWVFVDGALVLDLGGAHKVSSGSINFTDMKVYYKSATNDKADTTSVFDHWATQKDYVNTVDLAELFAAAGVNFSNKDASTKHTLQMFYMERGENESNCSISFNLPQNTGFRLNSNIDTSAVNPGLVDDTLITANKDFFNYHIGNKAATSTEYNNVKTTFAGAPSASNVSQIRTFDYSDSPFYPIKTNKVARDMLGVEYFLTAVNNATQDASNHDWKNTVNDSTFTMMKNVNFSLSDAYAESKTSSTDTKASGRVYENGYLNLLFGQSATFDSQIANNSMIQLTQDDVIYKIVDNGDGDTSVFHTDGTIYENRSVSDYYTTKYVIKDDDSGIEIGSGSGTNTLGSAVVASDKSANNGMFYFANYTGDSSDSANAMTVDYTNKVATSKIKISKKVESGASATDNFYFTLNLKNIFGNGSDEYKEYSGISYKVYNSADPSTPVAERTYGKAGIFFTAGQYAIVEGVPVGTDYTVNEKVRAGYDCDKSVKRTFDGENLIDETTTTYTSETTYPVSGSLKTILNNGFTTYDEVEYTNSKVAFTITFKYYDRDVQTGSASHISESPKSVVVPFAATETIEDSTGVKINYDKMITEAAVMAKLPDNVIDSYHMSSSNSAAVTYIKAQKILDEAFGGKTYGQQYSDAELAKHLDAYGRVQSAGNCTTSDGENWVTYFYGKDTVDEATARGYDPEVTSVTIWLSNTLKKYHPTFNYAPENAADNDITVVDGKYVASGNTKYTLSSDVYYDVRLGGSNYGVQRIDASTKYLQEFGISKGYCDEIPELTVNTTYKTKDLKFLYWSSDAKGNSVLSTDIDYGYRVTNNFKAYAVYGETDITVKGLSLTANDPDYFVDNDGTPKIRLNNMMNAYNCPANDKNIKNTSIVYVIDYSKKVDDLLKETGGLEAIQAKVREIVKANEGKKQFSDGYDIVINELKFTAPTNYDAEITGINYEVVPYGEEYVEGSGKIKLTNKNRLQFTTTFWQDDIWRTDMYAFAAMDYAEKVTGKNDDVNSWIISDNCIHYNFDENSVLTLINDPIGGTEYFKKTS